MRDDTRRIDPRSVLMERNAYQDCVTYEKYAASYVSYVFGTAASQDDLLRGFRQLSYNAIIKAFMRMFTRNAAPGRLSWAKHQGGRQRRDEDELMWDVLNRYDHHKRRERKRGHVKMTSVVAFVQQDFEKFGIELSEAKIKSLLRRAKNVKKQLIIK
jgi:hypothetical protein